MVPTDGGQGFQFVETDCTPCGADAPLQGQGLSLTGGLPIGLFLQGATGSVPLSLSGVNSAVGVMKFDGAGNVSVSLTAVGGASSTPLPQPSVEPIPSIPMAAARSISKRHPVNPVPLIRL